MIKIELPFIYVSTKNNTLVFEVREYLDKRTKFNKNKYFIEQKYYGEHIDFSLQKNESSFCCSGSQDDYIDQKLISSTFGTGNNLEFSLLLDNSDGTKVNRFFFKEAKLINKEKSFGPHCRYPIQTLDILEIDEVLNLELHTYYSIFEDSDVIAVSKKLINKGDKSCNILRMYSFELPIESKKLSIFSYDGAWLYERYRHETSLESGAYKISSFVGQSSHKHNPYFEVFDKTNNAYYGFNFVYAGNHVETVEVNPSGHSKVMIGINDIGFNYEVKPNESFDTPEAIFVYSKDYDLISLEMHNFVKQQILNPDFSNKIRPVLFNSWEGCAFNINEDSMIEMAKIAKSIGIELFVMDDGWFLNRNNDFKALGDWVYDPKKFPNGLKSFSDKIHTLGLQFGIWVEPEMISIDSDLYRTHPDWALIVPNREPIERRQQLTLDMSNLNVIDYVYKAVKGVIDESKADYIKWDYNRFIIDVYSNYGTKSGEFMHKFILGTYSVLEKLTSEYPNVLFNCCSSGGGRFDLGMLYYMPESQGSDDTNTYCRSFISCGTLRGYPQCSYGAHVSIDGCPIKEGTHLASLEDRFNLSCASSFGYEMDLRKYSFEELEVMKKQIVFFKEHAKLLQFGKFYNCDDSFIDDRYYSYCIVDDNQDEAIFYISELERDVPAKIWKLKGLDENKIYHLEMRKQYNLKDEDLIMKDISGKVLMHEGISLGSLNNCIDKDKFNGINSRIIFIKDISSYKEDK